METIELEVRDKRHFSIPENFSVEDLLEINLEDYKTAEDGNFRHIRNKNLFCTDYKIRKTDCLGIPCNDCVFDNENTIKAYIKTIKNK